METPPPAIATCFFCAEQLRYREVHETTAWLAHKPGAPRLYACPEHWDEIRSLGVAFGPGGYPRIRRPADHLPRPAAAGHNLLPLVEQLFAREWLLERVVDAYRVYVDVLEGEPVAPTEERVELAAFKLNEALAGLEKGPVPVGGE